jgi:hypothetical protein
MKEVNLDEILKSFLTLEAMKANNSDYTYNMVLAAMKEACRQTLELAYENAMVTPCNCHVNGKTSIELCLKDGRFVITDKQSILDTIKQVKL